MTTQTLSPRDTGEIQFTEDTTRDLTRLRNAPRPSPLPRTGLADTLVVSLPKRAGFFMPDFTEPTPMPLPPPLPIPSGPQPKVRGLKVLVPLEREEPKRYIGRRRDPLDREGPSGYVGRHVRPSLLSRMFGDAR